MGTNAVPSSCIRLYYAYYTLVSDPQIFNNMDKLLKIDEAHRETFDTELRHIKAVGEYSFKYQ